MFTKGITHGSSVNASEASKLWWNQTTKEERFWNNVVVLTYDLGCWLWVSRTNEDGYGRTDWKGRSTFAHRVAWELKNGPIPDGLQVLHKCDNPPCCNPDHLFLGTNLDNVKDKISKGRMQRPFGDNAPNTKILSKDILQIVEMWNARNTTEEIAQRFNVHRETIRAVLKRVGHFYPKNSPIELTPASMAEGSIAGESAAESHP